MEWEGEKLKKEVKADISEELADEVEQIWTKATIPS